MTKSSMALLLAACLLSLTGSPASADQDMTVTAPSPYVERVPYSAIDLGSDRGVRDLRHRVRSAAHRVCAPAAETFTATYNEVSCFSPTFRDALAQVDDAVARQRGGERIAMSSVTVRAR